MTTIASTDDKATEATLSGERTDLLAILATRRFFLRYTAQGLSDEQAAQCPTVSELCIGGLIKHVTQAEAGWARFIVVGAEGVSGGSEEHANGFRMLPGETLASLLDAYEEVAVRTDELVRTVDLDSSHPLPEAPWFEPGASWSARTALLHIATETAQHAGHADIIRETLDGQKSMG